MKYENAHVGMEHQTFWNWIVELEQDRGIGTWKRQEVYMLLHTCLLTWQVGLYMVKTT